MLCPRSICVTLPKAWDWDTVGLVVVHIVSQSICVTLARSLGRGHSGPGGSAHCLLVALCRLQGILSMVLGHSVPGGGTHYVLVLFITLILNLRLGHSGPAAHCVPLPVSWCNHDPTPKPGKQPLSWTGSGTQWGWPCAGTVTYFRVSGVGTIICFGVGFYMPSAIFGGHCLSHWCMYYFFLFLWQFLQEQLMHIYIQWN